MLCPCVINVVIKIRGVINYKKVGVFPLFCNMWDPFYGFYILIWAKNIEAKGGEGGKLLKTLFYGLQGGKRLPKSSSSHIYEL